MLKMESVGLELGRLPPPQRSGATLEGTINTNNISGQNFSLLKWRNQVSSVETLSLGKGLYPRLLPNPA